MISSKDISLQNLFLSREAMNSFHKQFIYYQAANKTVYCISAIPPVAPSHAASGNSSSSISANPSRNLGVDPEQFP